MIYIISIIIIVIIALIWFSGMRAKEYAVRVCKSLCDKRNLQLLDDTVSLRKTFLKRGETGSLQLHRIYEFEFLTTTDERRNSRILLCGDSVTELEPLEQHKHVNNVITFPKAKNDPQGFE